MRTNKMNQLGPSKSLSLLINRPSSILEYWLLVTKIDCQPMLMPIQIQFYFVQVKWWFLFQLCSHSPFHKRSVSSLFRHNVTRRPDRRNGISRCVINEWTGNGLLLNRISRVRGGAVKSIREQTIQVHGHRTCSSSRMRTRPLKHSEQSLVTKSDVNPLKGNWFLHAYWIFIRLPHHFYNKIMISLSF